MARLPFLIKYTRSGAGGTGTDAYRTTCSCEKQVANFLGITDRIYTPSEGDAVDRAGYTRSYTKADGTPGETIIPAGKRIYLANPKAGAKKILLRTGARTAQGNKRTLSMTFPSFVSVPEIADALGELIPSTKFATTPTTGATEIEPFFSIVGGGTYPIVPSAAAIASTPTAAATTEAQQVAITTTTKSRKKRSKTTT
jgi:hypothetical protein